MALDNKHLLHLRAARLTGLAYLTMAVTGALSYFVLRPRLSVTGDASATMMRLVDNETLARIGLVVDLALVTSASVTALLFFALFRKVDSVLAAALTAFACMSAVVGTIGVIFSAKALNVAVGGPDANEDAANVVLLLSELNETAWSINALFFGLWLLPMGWLVLRSGWMPRILGWTLVLGGAGYVASCAVDQLQPENSALVELLTFPASIGEFAMILYLLVRGVSSESSDPPPRRFALSHDHTTLAVSS